MSLFSSQEGNRQLPAPGSMLFQSEDQCSSFSPSLEASDLERHVPSDDMPRRFSLAEILSATNNFDDPLVIGEGGFGKVYKGFIDYGSTTVAIKRSKAKSVQGSGEFWAEIMTLSKPRHPHLVTLIGYCDESEEMILVYEYMANGTLADHLYRKQHGSNYIYYPLNWEERLKICIGAARGLDYLHSDSERSVIHRDVKTTNILLDENWVAKISDFGLSKICATDQTHTHFTTDIKGTFGYLDPQYFFTRRLTKKTDVYAFGVVLLEVLCARPPVERVEREQFRSLSDWARLCIRKGTFDQIIDPSLRGQISVSSLKLFAEVAIRCLHKCARERPTMAKVAESLELVLALQMRQPKAIIANYVSKVSSLVIRGLGIDLCRRIWARFYCKDASSFRLWTDPVLPSSAIKQYRRFSLAEIRASTNNFHENLVLGNFGHSKVYRGFMDLGNVEIAIRRWKYDASNEAKIEQMKTEIYIQSQLRHVNIISLIGYCKDKRETMIVYEYLANRSLYHRLHEFKRHPPLPWGRRLQVGIDAARGLQYLHAGNRLRIIHHNLKSLSIILDERWVAKISNLEYAKVLPDIESSAICTTLLGDNIDYIDPEYLATTKLTTKSDVYSFGVILLELLCGRKPVIPSEDESEANLVPWFKTNMENGTIERVIDPYLVNQIAPECLEEYVNVAAHCVREKGIERPEMDDVLGRLWCARQLQERWRNLRQQQQQPLSDGFGDEMEVLSGSSMTGSSEGMISYASLDETDYLSGNLAR
ncbi:probable LRR receptor-like serine/threonine-protein kinase At4g29180 isoform X2 [Diospyros lotus]|uniref:probable LRR receptor-like serine/threonine-protein kinase At4g29180 isoform X2 n=1 Tax=Diospyros lotus TaxID=55363 RepID=UPI002259A311|nr:probable LRR receptor-like serine/threonine-protein kinase At4g29180 isoform X2 [Diospyros lotus]